MEDVMKQLVPVCIEAIKTGKTLGVWYLLVVGVIPLVKTILNWTFFLVFIKTLLSFVKTEVDKSDAKR